MKTDDVIIKVNEENDYVTLVTCTPRVLNTHRLLVRGTRIQENIGDTEKIEEENKMDFKLEELQNKSKIKIYISIVLFLIFFFFLLFFLKEDKKGSE